MCYGRCGLYRLLFFDHGAEARIEAVAKEYPTAQQTGAQLGGTPGADDCGSPTDADFEAAGGIDRIHRLSEHNATSVSFQSFILSEK